MKIKIAVGKHQIYWTDESPSNRYGIGCIEIDGEDYGPQDYTPYGFQTNQLLINLYQYPGWELESIENKAIIRRFMQQWPDGPQFDEVR